MLKAATGLFHQGATPITEAWTEAGVKRGLINYHYGSKERSDRRRPPYVDDGAGSWRCPETVKQMDKSQLFFVRTYVVFCAKHPELNRLMIQEGMATIGAWPGYWTAPYVRGTSKHAASLTSRSSVSFRKWTPITLLPNRRGDADFLKRRGG